MNAKDLLTQSESRTASEKDRKKFSLSLLFSLGVKNPYAVFPLPDSDSTPIPMPIPIQIANIITCSTVSTEPILIPIPIPVLMQMGTVPNLTLISVLIW